MESRREQVIWRLERLLGDTCKGERMAGEPHPPSDSICTEDFVRCFREEMVELILPEGSIRELDKEEKVERTTTLVSDPRQSEPNGQSVLSVDVRATDKKGERSKETDYYCHHKPGQREELERCLSDSSAYKMSHDSENEGAGQRHKASCNFQHINIRSPEARLLAGTKHRCTASTCTV